MFVVFFFNQLKFLFCNYFLNNDNESFYSSLFSMLFVYFELEKRGNK